MTVFDRFSPGDTPVPRHPRRSVTRDELARHLYIHAHDAEGAPQSWQDAGALEWDEDMVTDEDRAGCYARADRMIADGKVPS